MAVDLENFLKALSSRRAVAPDIMNGTKISGMEIMILYNISITVDIATVWIIYSTDFVNQCLL
jgi:hypothetical protein